MKYPKVKVHATRTPDNIRKQIRELHELGWITNHIAKEFNLDWHTVKEIFDEDYRNERKARNIAHAKEKYKIPYERKKQNARVDAVRKRRLETDKDYKEWYKTVLKRGSQKYWDVHRKRLNKKALERYHKKKRRSAAG